MAQAYNPKELNQRLSMLMGRPINVGYQGGKMNPALTGDANMSLGGKIHFARDRYNQLLAAPKMSPGMALTLGILGHELGHFSTGGKAVGIPNATGGTDYPDPDEELKLADQWGYTNMGRILTALGMSPSYAKQIIKAHKTSRRLHGYDDS